MGIELVPLLNGLIMSFVMGMDDQSEQIQILTEQTLSKINETVGNVFFFSSLWMSILKI